MRMIPSITLVNQQAKINPFSLFTQHFNPQREIAKGFLINSGMAVDIFEPLKDLQGNKLKGANWYRNAVSLITDRSSPADLMSSGKLLGRPSGGRMSMFFYDPKTKARLPYYDIS